MIFRGIRRSDRSFSDPGEARTLDPLIKSQLLYQLSYGVFVDASANSVFATPFRFCVAKLESFFETTKSFEIFFNDYLHFPISTNHFYTLRPGGPKSSATPGKAVGRAWGREGPQHLSLGEAMS